MSGMTSIASTPPTNGGSAAGGAGHPSAPAGGAPPPESERVRLARLARMVALGVPGVVGTDAGPDGRFATGDRDHRLDGVTCIAAAAGGYDVSLRLVCGLVPLPSLGTAVRSAVSAAAVGSGLALHSIDVHVAAITDGGST